MQLYKKILSWFVLLVGAVSSIAISNDRIAKLCQQGAYGDLFAQSVHKRFYICQRLQEPVWLLIQQEGFSMAMIRNKAALLCEHRGMRQRLDHGDRGMLAAIWSDFSSSAYLESERYTYEFIALIALCYQNLLMSSSHLTEENEVKNALYSCQYCLLKKMLPIECLLTLVEGFFEVYTSNNQNDIKESTLKHFLRTSLVSKKIVSDIACDNDVPMAAHFNEVLKRVGTSYATRDFVVAHALGLYCKQRLSRHVFFVARSIEQLPIDLLVVTRTVCKHEHVDVCIQAMLDKRSSQPLIHTWRQIDRFASRGDRQFLVEFSFLLFVLYKAACGDCKVAKNDASSAFNLPSLHDIFALYDRIAALPLPELFYLLDTVIMQTDDFLELYELRSDLSWRQWITRYWWLPPIVALALGVSWLKSMYYYTATYA